MTQLINGLISIIASILEGIFVGISDAIVELVPSKRKESYNADYLDVNKILGTNEKGFCLNGTLQLPLNRSFENAIIFGGSGSKKSSGILITSVLKMNIGSLIIHDPSFEIFKATATAKARDGYTIKVLNYCNPLISEKYNPLARIKNKSDVKKLAKALVHTTMGTGTKDIFWNSSAEGLIEIFTNYTVFYAEAHNKNLGYVLHLVELFSATPTQVDQLIVATKDEQLLKLYKGYVALDSKMLLSIVQTAKVALAIFGDEDIQKVTGSDTIDFDSLRNTKTIIYITNSIKDLAYYKTLSSIFFEQLFGFIMDSVPPKESLPIHILLDEAGALSLQNSLPIATANVRKYFSGLLLVFQSQNFLFDIYGIQAGRNILSNCFAKVYCPGMTLETARELEILGGKFEYTDPQTGAKKVRSLVTMDEARTAKEAFLVLGNYPLIKTKLTPFFEQRKLLALTQLPVYALRENEPSIEIEEISEVPNEEKA